MDKEKIISLENLNQYSDETSDKIKEKIAEHTDNGDIHVTVVDKNNWNGKVDSNQGTSNAGKLLGTNSNGDVVAIQGYGFEYDETTKMLKYGTDPTTNLNQGIGLDNTLSKKGYAAEASAVGELKSDLGHYVEKDILYENKGVLESGLLGVGNETYAQGNHLQFSVQANEVYDISGRHWNATFPLYFVKNVSGAVIKTFNGVENTDYSNEQLKIPNDGVTLVVTGRYNYNATATKKTYIDNVIRKSNTNYTIVNMGDSLFGNYRDETSISNQIAELTGAKVYNCGFGGSWITSSENANIAKFGLFQLSDAIATGNWTSQDNAIGGQGTLDYYAETLALLKSIDFSKVDILTFNHGTNDYTMGRPVDYELEPKNPYTYGSAMRYCIERLLTAYPNLRIVIITPAWRWFSDGTDSDTKTYSGGENATLISYKDKAVEIGKEYHIPVVNVYDNQSINKFNKNQWFEDYTHPNANGRKMMAKLIAKTIESM